MHLGTGFGQPFANDARLRARLRSGSGSGDVSLNLTSLPHGSVVVMD